MMEGGQEKGKRESDGKVEGEDEKSYVILPNMVLNLSCKTGQIYGAIKEPH